MSTKTTFKRIALVAAASLGLSVFSAVPSKAAPSQVTVTVTNGTKVLGSANADTSTGGLVTVTANHSLSTDSTLVTIMPKTYPTGASTLNITGNLVFIDTAVSGLSLSTSDTVTMVANDTTQFALNTALMTGYAPEAASAAQVGTASARSLSNQSLGNKATADSITTTATGGGSLRAFALKTGSSSTGYVGARFRLYLDDPARAAGGIPAGTYTYTITVTPYTGGTAGTPVTSDISIVVAGIASSGTTSTAYIGAGTTSATFNSETLTVAATASNTTAVANYTITLRDADGLGTGVAESVTATTTLGNVGDAATNPTILGQNVQLKYTAGSSSSLVIGIFGSGTSGTATVCAKTATITFPCKTVVFYSTTAASLTATQVSSTLAVGSNSTAFTAKALDASGNLIPTSTSVYIFSDNTAVVSETASACTIASTNDKVNCTLTGVTPGTANIMFGTNSAKANATAAFKVTVTNSAIASIALTSNKTSYAPGEVAYIRVTAKDSAGNSVAPQTIGSFFSSTGITTDVGLGANSDTTGLAATSVTLAAKTTTGYATGDAVAQFTVYMPTGASSITFSATGGTGLPAALQGKAITPLTVSVADSGSQALAAVTALASQVSAFITKINAQITTLTDLVMKIQKKVKA